MFRLTGKHGKALVGTSLKDSMFREAGNERKFGFVMVKSTFQEHSSRYLLKVYHCEQIRSVRNMHENKGRETSIRPYVKPDDLLSVADTLML